MAAAGKYKHRVEIQQNTPTKNALNEDVPNWVLYKKVWANVRFETGAEFNRANREGTELKASVRMRQRSDITNTMRIIYKGLVLNIIAPPMPDDMGVDMDIAVSTKEV